MSDLIQKLLKISRVKDGLVAGVENLDVHGRKFIADGRFFTKDGEYTSELKSFINSLSDTEVQKLIEAGIMYYDIRSKFWRENPAFTVVFALAFAKKLQKINGKKNGIILFLATDAYKKHFETAQVFVDTILRTGICDNGGGIYYWGIVNGGDIRNYSQLYHAVNKEGGNWVFFTMSHRPEDFLGAKLGINAKVYCGSEIRHCEGITSGTLFDAIIEKDFAEIKNKNYFLENIITVSDCLKNNIQVAADMIRATSCTDIIETNRLLEGIKIGVDMGGNPLVKNAVDILRYLGADVLVDNEKIDPDFGIENIIDPNEHHSEAIKRIKKRAEETNFPWLIFDPDGDRGSFVAVNSKRESVSMNGSELLLLAIENLSLSYKSKGIIPTIICDMRTGVAIKDLGEILNSKGYPVKIVPHEAGYPFFMKGMAKLPADVAVENTSHEFTNPMTNPNWGAPKEHNFLGYQGGDNAALFLIYLLGCMKYLWAGRNPVQQLEWIRKKYNLRETFVDEKKPSLLSADDKHKYSIAEELKKIADEWFKSSNKFIINFGDPNVNLTSGVHIINKKTKAMMLVRFSNTGSSFTISGEGYTLAELDEMLKLGHKMMITAVERLKGFITTPENFEQNGLPQGKLFAFFENDSAVLRD